MLRVGIHENIAVVDAKVENNLLNVTVKKVGNEDALSMLTASSDKTPGVGEDHTFKFFPLKNTAWNGTALTANDIFDNIQDYKNQLHHILKNFMKESEIDWESALPKGTNLTSDNLYDEINKQDVLDVISQNINEYFVKMITPHLGEDNLYRMVFVRQSRNKHYPSLRRRYLNSYPFMEPMSIPKEQSKVKFTKYEMSNGLDSGEPVEADQPDTSSNETAANYFKSVQ